jgi:hypothetical protein
LEYWKDWEEDEAAPLDEEPDAPLELEFWLEDWLDELEECSWLTINPLIPLPPAHSNLAVPGLL